jgi:hypothetical protein
VWRTELCLATAGKQVPCGPDWIHEVKHDGYRMLVIRDNDSVRLLSRNGTDWTKRYCWITEAALKIRQRQFVIDGEAVVLGVDGISDFNALHSQHDGKCNFMPSIFSPWVAMTCDHCPCTRARLTWSNFSPAGPKGITVAPFERGEIGPDLFEPRAAWALRAWSRNIAIGLTAAAGRSSGSRSRTEATLRWSVIGTS